MDHVGEACFYSPFSAQVGFCVKKYFKTSYDRVKQGFGIIVCLSWLGALQRRVVR
jgi:hypothetical protein